VRKKVWSLRNQSSFQGKRSEGAKESGGTKPRRVWGPAGGKKQSLMKGEKGLDLEQTNYWVENEGTVGPRTLS